MVGSRGLRVAPPGHWDTSRELCIQVSAFLKAMSCDMQSVLRYGLGIDQR